MGLPSGFRGRRLAWVVLVTGGPLCAVGSAVAMPLERLAESGVGQLSPQSDK